VRTCVRTLAVGLLIALGLLVPASASAFPYLTINAARRAIVRYELRYLAEEEERGRFWISGCDHETLDPVLVWCRSRGYAYPLVGGPVERWNVWVWAELMPNGQIEVGEGE
jgi:hypothetical protein